MRLDENVVESHKPTTRHMLTQKKNQNLQNVRSEYHSADNPNSPGKDMEDYQFMH
jgi:hypothetical protein